MKVASEQGEKAAAELQEKLTEFLIEKANEKAVLWQKNRKHLLEVKPSINYLKLLLKQ